MNETPKPQEYDALYVAKILSDGARLLASIQAEVREIAREVTKPIQNAS